MKQHDAVIEAMRKNGGYATLGWLYKNVFSVKGVEWKTKTPFASIRRIVQDERFFFKIRPGLWALKEAKNKLPFTEILEEKASPKTKLEFNHTYYQGLLVEIGNIKGFYTTIPNQDKNKQFLEKPLSEIASAETIYKFTYDNIVQRARTIDVIWFNERKLPNSVFEVEHSTNIQDSLIKFIELQDFNVKFWIVADQKRLREYNSKVSYSAFKSIVGRINFIDYETVSKLHSKSIELYLIESQL